MKVNKWTVGLAAVGLVSLPATALAEEELSPVQTALDSTVISGYVNTSAQWDFGTGNYGAPRYAFNNNKQDGFNLNAVKLTIERPFTETQWAAGYKVDLMFGPDADAIGTTLGGDGTDNFAVRQAYVELRTPVGNGLDFKMGVFDGILGYESTDAGSNANMTRSWGYTIEPVAHTGLLGSYEFNKVIKASVGVANTMGACINERAWPDKSETFKTYMGSLTLTAPDSMGFMAGSRLYAAIVNGYDSIAGLPGGQAGLNSTHYYVGGTLATPVEGFQLGGAFDYGDWHDDDGSVGHAWALAGYLSYQMTEKLSAHARVEYFSASDSVVDLMSSPQPLAPAFDSPEGIAKNIFSTTATLQYDLWKNVMTRLEFRWDHAGGSGEPFGGTDADGGGKDNNYMLAANVIYKF
ncbi:MAG: outer membrane beta-barrel protein [Verrucomicrobia bacterium]|nr:outer membrane beta-barrel protein [Verrucomicrobiota bacterium]